MPAFKYQSKEVLPGNLGHTRAQARGVQAPRLTPPQQAAVTKGQTVMKRAAVQPTYRPPNKVGEAIADSTINLGNLFFRRSMQLADRQASLEADEAISLYRRSVTDLYYNEKNGLFSVTGAAGSKIYAANKDQVDKLRDQFGENLSPAARMKYVAGVQGYHNSYLDQLARKQAANGTLYQKEVRILREGSDAEDMFSFLSEGNIPAIIATIRDDDATLSPLEQQLRRDRMVSSVLSSADAQGVSADSMENLFDHIKHLASQDVQNRLAEDVETYRRAKEIEAEQARQKQRNDLADLRVKQDQAFVQAFYDGELTPSMVLKSQLSASRQEHWLAKLKGMESPKHEEKKAALKALAIAGEFTLPTADLAIEAGIIDGEEASKMLKNSKSWAELRKGGGDDVAVALDKAQEYYRKKVYSDDPKENIDRYYALKEKLTSLEDGADPIGVLEQEVNPDKEGWLSRFFSGFLGGDIEPEILPETSMEITPEIEATMARLDRAFFAKHGQSIYDEYSKDDVARFATVYLQQEALRAPSEVDNDALAAEIEDARLSRMYTPEGVEEAEEELSTIVEEVEEQDEPTPAQVDQVDRLRKAYGVPAPPQAQYPNPAQELVDNINFKEAFLRDVKAILKRLRKISDENLKKYPNQGRPAQ